MKIDFFTSLGNRLVVMAGLNAIGSAPFLASTSSLKVKDLVLKYLGGFALSLAAESTILFCGTRINISSNLLTVSRAIFHLGTPLLFSFCQSCLFPQSPSETSPTGSQQQPPILVKPAEALTRGARFAPAPIPPSQPSSTASQRAPSLVPIAPAPIPPSQPSSTASQRAPSLVPIAPAPIPPSQPSSTASKRAPSLVPSALIQHPINPPIQPVISPDQLIIDKAAEFIRQAVAEGHPIFDIKGEQAEIYARRFPGHTILRTISTGKGLGCTHAFPDTGEIKKWKYDLECTDNHFFFANRDERGELLERFESIDEIIEKNLKPNNYRTFFTQADLEQTRDFRTWPELYGSITRGQAEDILKRKDGPSWLLRKSEKRAEGFVLSRKYYVENGDGTQTTRQEFAHLAIDSTQVFAESLLWLYGYNQLISSKNKSFEPSPVAPAVLGVYGFLGSEALIDLNVDVKKEIRTYQNLSLEHVESIFQRVPVGSWMVRLSSNDVPTVTIKRMGGLLEHSAIGRLTMYDLYARYGAEGFLRGDKAVDCPDVYGILSQEDAEDILERTQSGNWIIALSKNLEPYILQKNSNQVVVEKISNFNRTQYTQKYGRESLITPSTKLRKVEEVISSQVTTEKGLRAGYIITKSWDSKEPQQHFINRMHETVKKKFSPGRFVVNPTNILVYASKREMCASLSFDKKTFQGYSRDCSVYRTASLEEETQALLNKGKEFFKSLSPLRVDTPANITIHSTNQEILKSLLSKYQAIVIGESHPDPVPKRFIVENVTFLKSLGVTTLYLEHLCFDSIQEDLDTYFTQPSGSQMPTTLDEYLKFLDSGFKISEMGPPGFLELVKSAKEAGIKVVAIDTEASYDAGYSSFGGSQGADRMIGMNYQCKLIYEKRKPEGKAIFLVGSAHMGYCDGVPGLSEQFGFPNILVGKGPSREVKLEVNNFARTEGFQGKINVSLTLPL